MLPPSGDHSCNSCRASCEQEQILQQSDADQGTTFCKSSSQRRARSQADSVVAWVVCDALFERQRLQKLCRATCQRRPAAIAPMATVQLTASGCRLCIRMPPNKHKASSQRLAFSHADNVEFRVISERRPCCACMSDNASSHCRPFSQAKMPAFIIGRLGTTRRSEAELRSCKASSHRCQDAAPAKGGPTRNS